MKDEKSILKDYRIQFSRSSTNLNCINTIISHRIGEKYLEIMSGYMIVNHENICNNKLRIIEKIASKANIGLENTLVLNPIIDNLGLPDIDSLPPFLQDFQQKMEAGHEIIKLQSFNSFVDIAINNASEINYISLLPLNNIILVIREQSNEEMLLEEKGIKTLNKRIEHNKIIENLYNISLNKKIQKM